MPSDSGGATQPLPGEHSTALKVLWPAVAAVAPGGLLVWEAFTLDARAVRPNLPARWCLDEGEPASLLPEGFTVLEQRDVPDRDHGTKRGMLARRAAP